jgi:hypothetical protein
MRKRGWHFRMRQGRLNDGNLPLFRERSPGPLDFAGPTTTATRAKPARPADSSRRFEVPVTSSKTGRRCVAAGESGGEGLLGLWLTAPLPAWQGASPVQRSRASSSVLTGVSDSYLAFGTPERHDDGIVTSDDRNDDNLQLFRAKRAGIYDAAADLFSPARSA